MEKPIVSIIVPVFNTEKYVEDCIRSVLAQSYGNIELILVNDGSTDGSDAICKRFEHLPGVRYLKQDNQGATAARRRGVEAAAGEWILFVDSDDLLAPDAVAGMLEAGGSAGIVYGGNQFLERVNYLPDRLDRQRYLEMQYGRELSAGPWAKLFRKSLFDEKTLAFPRHLNRGEDYLMNLMLAINNQTDVHVYKHQVYTLGNNPESTCHTHRLTLDYMYELSKMGDNLVKAFIPADVFVRQRVKQRMFFFIEVLREMGFAGNPRHPFVQDTKCCLDEAKEWRPLDRWMLSLSSPWAVKTVWTIQRAVKKLVRVLFNSHAS